MCFANMEISEDVFESTIAQVCNVHCIPALKSLQRLCLTTVVSSLRRSCLPADEIWEKFNLSSLAYGVQFVIAELSPAVARACYHFGYMPFIFYYERTSVECFRVYIIYQSTTTECSRFQSLVY